ncbi:16S rRNA (cytosine(967)-C(5))-methyltransferase RsmB [Volucribacter amazonae]|uniref:16S rRNA (cytosine(967)-C(5))-methyltransferase n=1 Tax=Volucribacter amazonae TaxID=256731 RepID=A0A9X4PPA8_9PAST|nr:16S rRNA (cytosine(967)-C(5))-methyltransferase RsmB [Volucribacter amazonae]MDG6895253.1 16S rRNA (cytosine(967)-C(5))-methyltransferase [Volucribacter amazonae]
MKKISPKATALSVRAATAEIMLNLLDKGQSLSTLLPDYQNKIKGVDLPLLQEMCFGICRVLPRLEQIIQHLVQKPLKNKTRIVHCLLLVGLYQILYTRIPVHAAVSETVNASKALNIEHFRALLNGVLRRFLREQPEILAQVDQHWQTLHPEWLVNKLKQQYPNWREIIDANNQKPPMWLRINPQYSDVAGYQKLFAEPSYTSEHPQALRLATPLAVNKLPHFAEGWATVQDIHTQWAGLLLAPENGEFILDACAAPGGKTTHILELAPQAQVIALDIEPKRLARVQQNLDRLQQQAQLICGDASQPDSWFKQIPTSKSLFDRILLDAPCSATGVIRRHPDIKWLRQASDIAPLVQLQQQILNALWQRLKPNGILLYATCSLLAEENQQQISQFLQQHKDAELMPLPFTPSQQIGFQFIPQQEGGDGFYYAKLRKRAK